MGPAWRVATMYKIPILNIKGFEVRAEFHSVSSIGYQRIVFLPLGNRQTCSVNKAWPFPEGNCVYGFVYYIVKYDKVDPTCDDSSTVTKKFGGVIKKEQP
jgi:hypothetical protein